MTIRKVLIAVILLLVQPAFALIDAVETSPGDIILPATVNGTMTFKSCEGECAGQHKRMRLTGETRFTLDGKAVKYEVFRREFATIRNSNRSFALVSYDTDTNTVTRIDINR